MTNSTEPYNLLKENLISTCFGLRLEPHVPWFDFFVKKLEYLKESGIMDFLISKSKQKQIRADDSGPKVLTMKDLEIGFLIWLITLGISCLVFAGEHFVHFIKRFHIYWRNQRNNKPKLIARSKKTKLRQQGKKQKKLVKIHPQVRTAWRE